jgi:hypothetical protein
VESLFGVAIYSGLTVIIAIPLGVALRIIGRGPQRVAESSFEKAITRLGTVILIIGLLAILPTICLYILLG